MKLTLKNKFFWMKVGIIGLGVFATGVAKARAAGVPMDPRVDIAAAIAPEVAIGLHKGTNYLWNKEIEEVNKKAEVVDFANAGDGVNGIWEAKEDRDWQLVKYTDWDTYFKEKFSQK
ncbi:exported protein of unknown function [endosymbiont DhMRE of Dentiscutata heterogama]|uniref:hypothetical protein n=1 Tax=endosymbiont DhMRE of Dentiscutata heterogama TaxID=1609546 RepID=UPI000629D473|nr:hypothetical protein [endosymbiont DhMRE of Dentiscutata heterogama]CFW93465.1 exported protein of unknown function [endosymbiont DhMRE of Dentiscutata heterogama]